MATNTLHERQKVVMIWYEKPAESVTQKLVSNHPNLEVEFYHAGSVAKDIPDDIIRDATILLTNYHLPDPKRAPSLKLVQTVSAGTEQLLCHPIYTNSSIPLTNSTGIHGSQIAEWVVMTMLAHTHHFPELLDRQREHKWGNSQEQKPVTDLCGQRVGVLGYGSIGRQVARVCQAMGMDVIAYTASLRSTQESKIDHGFMIPGIGDPDGTIPIAWYSGLDRESLHEFLEQNIDVLVVSMPLTRDTAHILGKEEFAILGRNRNAFICNVGRGGILDQAALVDALKKIPCEGGLRGAALDVTDPEPLPKDSELWDLPNAFITPHVSGRSTAYMERVFRLLDANIARLESGQRLINVIERDTRAMGFRCNPLSDRGS